MGACHGIHGALDHRRRMLLVSLSLARSLALTHSRSCSLSLSPHGGLRGVHLQTNHARKRVLSVPRCPNHCTRHARKFHVETLVLCELGFNQNYYTFVLISLIKIVLCSKIHSTKFIHYKCFHIRFFCVLGACGFRFAGRGARQAENNTPCLEFGPQNLGFLEQCELCGLFCAGPKTSETADESI